MMKGKEPGWEKEPEDAKGSKLAGQGDRLGAWGSETDCEGDCNWDKNPVE